LHNPKALAAASARQNASDKRALYHGHVLECGAAAPLLLQESQDILLR